jgi:hypothetical protein
MKSLLLAVLVFVQADVDQLKTKATESFNKAESTLLGKPDVPNVPDVVEKCPCNGTGVITHGDGHKTACPGTDSGPCKFRKGDVTIVSDDVIVKPKRDHGLILMESLPGCLACEKVKQSKLLRDLLKSGWRFKVVEPMPGTRTVPRFTAIMGGEPIPMQSFTMDDIKKVNKVFEDKVKK